MEQYKANYAKQQDPPHPGAEAARRQRAAAAAGERPVA
jgi:hypothetical protein